MRSSLPARVGLWILAFVLGAVYGLGGTIAHAYAPGGVPLGLVLAIVGAASLLVAVRLLTGRWPALATGLGMMAATLVFSGRGPGGSVIVPDTPLAIVWSLAIPVAIGFVVAWPSPTAPQRLSSGGTDLDLTP